MEFSFSLDHSLNFSNRISILFFADLKNHSSGFNHDRVDGSGQGRGQQPRVRLEEFFVLGRLVHEGDDDDPEKDDRENCAQNKTELQK